MIGVKKAESIVAIAYVEKRSTYADNSSARFALAELPTDPNVTSMSASFLIEASDIQVLASEQVLTVHGESERTKARVYRKITLPPDACDTSATASHIDGLLTVTVPARAPAQPAAKRIKVSAPGVAALSKETAADAS